MNKSIIQQRLQSYQCRSSQEEEHALKEIAQEIALMALARGNFFKIAAFQGGTCLRILYGLNRFSEDLDFVLQYPVPDFSWQLYLRQLQEEFEAFNIHIEAQDRSKVTTAVKKAFLKDTSIGQLLTLEHYLPQAGKKIQIKLEIDTEPPEGSKFSVQYLDFPLPFAITTQDLTSLFAGKSHALLCRTYTKGRDWYDFIWYVSRKTPINFLLLSHALRQAAPWQGQNLNVDKKWYIEQIKAKILTIDWEAAKTDVAPFLKAQDLFSIDIWSTDFFLACLDKLAVYL